ncbi:MAG: DEAD/DEAH box helicase, partial [Halobacteriota archaeon]
ERIIVFPTRREIVVDQPTQYTRARLSQFAHLVDSTGTEPGTRGYLYRIRPEDVWAAPYDDLDALLRSVRSVLPRQSSQLESWVTDQWNRAHQFRLTTHSDGYVVLQASTESLMGNVARQKLTTEHLHAPLSDTESWVRDDAIGDIKRILYDAGYPVVDDRDLDTGEPLDIDLLTPLRAYQQTWVDTFLDQQAGVYVGPPGSGKTIAAIGTIAEVGGETLVLVPSRELATQWEAELLEHTSIAPGDVGQYHGGAKTIAPVTIATYQTAGMDRHRHLFDSRKWGLIIYDECQHVPSRIFRRSADLQAVHRLGLTASPVREDDKETEIFTLIGPPIGTDWTALIDKGFVAEPEIEIRYVPWRDDAARNEYVSAEGRDRYQLAAMNPAKIDEVRYLLSTHSSAKALVFVEYLEQGSKLADALDVPFLSGETPHHERRRLLDSFRRGDIRTLIVSRVADEGIDLPNAELAIVASGLGGSRRQGTQRAGRTMRPTGSAIVHVLATRGTREEDFAQRQQRHLAGKGIRIRETNASQ